MGQLDGVTVVGAEYTILSTVLIWSSLSLRIFNSLVVDRARAS